MYLHHHEVIEWSSSRPHGLSAKVDSRVWAYNLEEPLIDEGASFKARK